MSRRQTMVMGFEVPATKRDDLSERSDISSISAISQKRSNHDEIIDMKDKKNKRLVDKERLFLDVELNLRNEHENSFDEGQFNFAKNSQNYLHDAFYADKEKRNLWRGKFKSMMKEEGIITNENEFPKFLKDNNLEHFVNQSGYIDTFKYSFNVYVDNDDQTSERVADSVYFTKFLIAMNLIFRVSYVYKYSFDLGYKKYFNTIFKILVLQLVEFNSSENYLFTIPSETDQILFFSTVFIWLLSFIFFYILVRKYSVKRQIHLETFSIKYDYRPISVGKRFLFNLVLVLFLYLYIPIVRDSMVTVFFIYDQYKTTSTSTSSNIQNIFSTEGSTNAGLWIKFFLSIIVFLAFFLVPFFLFKLVKNNHPLLNPFDELNDTNFHSVNCPKTCSGALLDIEKRMCWDFIKDLYFVDLNRPISIFNYHNKLANVLGKYYNDNFTIKSPLMMLFKGYTYDCKYYLFWFLIKHYLFIFIVKIPFSSIFADAPENNMQKRSLASFSLSVILCLYFVLDGIKNFDKKFAFKHDMVLSLLVDIFIFLISLIGLLKVSIVGDYVFSSVQDQVDYNSMLSAMEVLSFVFFLLSVITLTIFMIYSIPQIREKIKTKELVVPWEWLDSELSEKDIKKAVTDFLWKPFWDSIFKHDHFCVANIDINDEKFIQLNLDGKRYDEFGLKDLAMNANNRVNAFKRRLVKSSYDEKNEFLEDEEMNNINNNLLQKEYDKENKLFEKIDSDYSYFENLSKSDILLRKLIQFKLEGIDCYWDGDVIGKRTCHNYFGRLLVTEFPFSLVIIYDETNEKVEIPKSGWVQLCKLNLHNYEILRQVSIREQLRVLHLKEVSYDENYFDKSFGKKKGKSNNEEMKKLMEEKKKVEVNIKNIKKGLKFIKNLKNSKNKKAADKNSKNKIDNLKQNPANSKTSKNKKVSNLPPREIKKGILHVESIIPDNPMTHGFKIYLKVYDPKKPNKLKETINFDSYDICLNARNFRYCRLNILLTMNDHLIREEDLVQERKKKDVYRKEKCYNRYLNELTLSSLFCNMIYDNSEVTLMEIFKYFLKYEKRNSIKIIPYLHLDGIMRALNLWQLLLTNPIQSLWYVFFHQLWTLNRVTISDLQLSKYFNPNTSLSICYYVFEKEKLKAFISKLDMQSLIKKDLIDALDKRIQELKNEEREKMKNKLIKGQEDGIINLAEKDMFKSEKKEFSLKKKKRNFNKNQSQIDSSEVRLNITDNKSGVTGITNNENPLDIEEEKLEVFLSGYQPFVDKFMQIITDYSPVMFCTPSWSYLTYNNEYLLTKMPEFVNEENRMIISEYFKSNMKNPIKLFEELGEYALFVGMYSDNEIFELYESKDLNCEDPQLAKFTLDKSNYLDTTSLRSRVKQKGLTTLDWGSKELNLVLPPTLKFIDDKFSNPLDANYAQKIDDRGRIFFVDNRHKKTSFLHPHMRKREKTRLERELELTFGKLPDGWEIINYKTSSNEVRLLYVNHNLKKTSWIDPRRKKIE
jgi:hypothetical protein